MRPPLLPALSILVCPTVLAQHYRFTGDSTGDFFGVAVHDIGDLDLDGVRDLLVGSYLDDAQGVNSGSVSVYSGGNGALLHFIPGEAAGDQFGIAIAAAGDLDQDGIEDFLIGAWLADSTAPDAGRVYLYSGASASLIRSFDGDSPAEHFGRSLASGGDWDSDGLPDLLVGAPDDSIIDAGRGSVRIVSGASGLPLLSLDGDAAGDAFGSSLCTLGDVDGDGVSDFAVGSPLADGIGSASGKVSVYSGATATLLHAITGAAAGDELGNSIAAIDDLDGDGYDDLLVAAWKSDVGAPEAGSILACSGSSGAVLFAVQGTSAGDGLGFGGVVGVGDVDGDGVSEFLAGAALADGNGTNAGYAAVYSGVDGELLFTFLGEDAGDLQGYAVASAGDVNGDGLADLFVGAPGDEPNGNLSGSALVYLGHCWTSTYCPATDNSTGSPAHLTTTGSLSISNNDMGLRAAPCPRHQFGYFFYGPNRTQIPLGHGYLCVGGGTVGLQRLNPVVQVNNQKVAFYPVDFGQPPMNGGPGWILPASTWNFQFWFRDPPAGTPTYNLSDALAITFCN